MNENDINRILRADDSLREAVRRREQRQPPMPAGLNERLMQRIEKEVPAKTPGRHRRIWPWIAAACVAAVMVVVTIWQVPQLSPASQVVNTTQSFPAPQGEGIEVGSGEQNSPEPRTIAKNKARHKPRRKASPRQELLLAQEALPAQAVDQGDRTLDSVQNHEPVPLIHQAEAKPTVLTECNLPITRPENYRYTPEEIALLKKQANEAYIKWMQLELEIAKYNLEQMAQQ